MRVLPLPGEDDVLRERKKALGDPAGTQRVAHSLGVTEAAAEIYLRSAGRGQCGWCGGAGVEPAKARTTDANEATDVPCEVCFGARRCVFCGGDRRVRIGSEAAGRDISRYRGFLAGLSADEGALATNRKDIAGWNEAFLKTHAGELEAAELERPTSHRREAAGAPAQGRRASESARDRAVQVLRAMTP